MKKQENQKLVAHVLLLVHGVIVGLSYIFVKLSMEYASSFDVLAHRFSLAFFSMLLFNRFSKRKLYYSKKDLLRLLPLGILYPTLFFILQILGLGYATAMQTGLVTSLSPIVTLFFAYALMREPVKRNQILGVVVAVLGVFFLQWMNLRQAESGEFIGFVLVLSSVFVMSLNIVLTRAYSKEYSWRKMTSYTLTLSFLVFNLIALISHGIQGDWQAFLHPLSQSSYLLVLSFLGILSSFVTAIITAFALTHVPSVSVAVFSSFSTLVTLVSSIVILGESFFWYHFVGSLCILFGAFVANNPIKSSANTRGE